jgi:RNA polymerase sigma factor (sigma-70 family)
MKQLQIPVPLRRNHGTSLDFEALYRDMRGPVYAYVYDCLRDVQRAEDATSAAFERAFRRLETFDPKRGTPQAWLFTIARSSVLDALRAESRQGRTESSVEPQASESLPDETHLTVRAAIAELGRFERELVGLKFYAGLTNREIADVVGRSESNVGTMLYRVLGKLREACSE